jgi:hypothetical protein
MLFHSKVVEGKKDVLNLYVLVGKVVKLDAKRKTKPGNKTDK